jgi:hypothetical protein
MARRFFHHERELCRMYWLPKRFATSNGQNARLLGLHCFWCMRLLHPIDFVREQTVGGYNLGRSRAGERWCKPCGLKWGRAQCGRWYKECYRDDGMAGLLAPADYNKYCSRCLGEPTVTWWGCAGCFQKEERRRQKEDWDAAPLGFGVVVVAARKWRSCQALWKRRKAACPQAGPVRLRFADRRAAEKTEEEEEEEEKRLRRQLYPHSSAVVDPARQSRQKRWQTRCRQCWEPNCQPRPFMSMVSSFRLPREQWCEECIADHDYFVKKPKSHEIAHTQQAPPKRFI